MWAGSDHAVIYIFTGLTSLEFAYMVVAQCYTPNSGLIHKEFSMHDSMHDNTLVNQIGCAELGISFIFIHVLCWSVL